MLLYAALCATRPQVHTHACTRAPRPLCSLCSPLSWDWYSGFLWVWAQHHNDSENKGYLTYTQQARKPSEGAQGMHPSPSPLVLSSPRPCRTPASEEPVNQSLLPGTSCAGPRCRRCDWTDGLLGRCVWQAQCRHCPSSLYPSFWRTVSVISVNNREHILWPHFTSLQFQGKQTSPNPTDNR